MNTELFARPYVISWNLTYKCNLACEHCYLDAGAKKAQKISTENFSDRSELSTDECKEVIDQIASFAPESLTILTGGEPLLRKDILPIIRHAAHKKLWTVVGTNGVLITDTLAKILKDEGVRGMALSLDALDPDRHDAFRVVKGAWDNTVKGAKVLDETDLSFIIQTTVAKHNAHELEEIADFAYNELGAKVWNLYFLVQTGRGQFVSDINEEEYRDVLINLHELQKKYHQKMVVNAKCAPHYVTTLLERDPDSPFLKSFTDGAGGCPAGTHYMGIRPNGDMTPCPYLPTFGGNLREEPIGEIWQNSDIFKNIRKRDSLGGKCGTCECSSLCGGCRARAYGTTTTMLTTLKGGTIESGDYMAEDPLCNFEVGTLKEQLIKIGTGTKRSDKIEYGLPIKETIKWQPAASERMKQIPAFVRGMVIKSVEKKCIEAGQEEVTLELLNEIRSNMPTPKVFAKKLFSKRDAQ